MTELDNIECDKTSINCDLLIDCCTRNGFAARSRKCVMLKT